VTSPPTVPPPDDPELAGATLRIHAAFDRIARTMAELPIANPALCVEVVGLRRFDAALLAVLVTPWTISLLLTPRGDDPRLLRLGPDEKQRWRFPSGEYDFVGGEEPELGRFQTCSLLSPTFAMGSQEEARALAHAALEGLLAPPVAEAPTASSPSPEAPPEPPAPPAPPPSRRAFLTFGRNR